MHGGSLPLPDQSLIARLQLAQQIEHQQGPSIRFYYPMNMLQLQEQQYSSNNDDTQFCGFALTDTHHLTRTNGSCRGRNSNATLNCRCHDHHEPHQELN
jgi:hypothetical protein